MVNKAEVMTIWTHAPAFVVVFLLTACSGEHPAQKSENLRALSSAIPPVLVLSFQHTSQPATDPGPVASISAAPTSLKVKFSAADVSHNHGATVIRYDWDFGDGNTASGINVTHHYTIPNTYTATLTLTDVSGQKGSSRRQILVSST